MVDTDFAIDWLNGRDGAGLVFRRLSNDGSEKLGISLATYGELLAGVQYSRNPRLTEQGIRQFLRLVDIVPITKRIMRRFALLKGELAHQGQVIGDFDTLIAATALQHGLILISRNTRHFGRVGGLQLQQGV